MPSNTNEEAQKQRRRDAWKSALIATVWMLLSASMVLLLRHFYVPEGFWNAVMLIAGLLELGMIIPVSESCHELQRGKLHSLESISITVLLCKANFLSCCTSKHFSPPYFMFSWEEIEGRRNMLIVVNIHVFT